MKFSIQGFFSKCDQIRRKLRIWSHLLKKFLMENIIFCAVCLNWWQFDEGMVSKIIKVPDSEVYSEPSQTSKMKCFVKIANGFQSLTVFAKSSILDV